MGKSTLMHHVAVHKMREKAAGRDSDAIVVVDPHADLVGGLLEHVPEELADRVRLIDLADRSRSPGINLLDTRIFSDRDRTADSVVRVARGLWDQWGPRMQSILEQTVKTLHEANEHPATDEHEQHTILDGLKLLSNDPFRNSVLAKVDDPYLLEWWARDFGSWHRQYRAEALAPVQTRLSYYASSKRARAILGQRRSTIDLRETILDGGILLVSTVPGDGGQGRGGPGGRVPPQPGGRRDPRAGEPLPSRAQRRAGRRGTRCSRCPAWTTKACCPSWASSARPSSWPPRASPSSTTSPARCATRSSPTWAASPSSRCPGPTPERWCGSWARSACPRTTSCPCPCITATSRATVGTERMPAFSMMVRKPERGDPDAADRIRAAASSYTVSARQANYADADGHGKVDGYRRGIDDLRDGDGSPAMPEREAPSEPDRVEAAQQAESGGPGGEAMKPTDRKLLSALASMPFIDRLEAVAVTGWSRGAVYEGFGRLEDAGLAASVPHAADLTPPTRRYRITGDGLRSLAGGQGR